MMKFQTASSTRDDNNFNNINIINIRRNVSYNNNNNDINNDSSEQLQRDVLMINTGSGHSNNNNNINMIRTTSSTSRSSNNKSSSRNNNNSNSSNRTVFISVLCFIAGAFLAMLTSSSSSENMFWHYYYYNNDSSSSSLLTNIVPPGEALRMEAQWPPLGTIYRISDDQRRIIVLFVSCEKLNLADNAAGVLINKFNITNFAFVPLDDTTYEILLNTYPDHVIPPITLNKYTRYDTIIPSAMLQFIYHRMQVLYTTVDLVWKINMLEMFDQDVRTNNYDIVYTKDESIIYFAPKQQSMGKLISFVRLWKKQPSNKQQEQLMTVPRMKSTFRRMKNSNWPYSNMYDFNNKDDGNEYIKLTLVEHWPEKGLWNPSGRLLNTTIMYDCTVPYVKRINDKTPDPVSNNTSIVSAPIISSMMNNHNQRKKKLKLLRQQRQQITSSNSNNINDNKKKGNTTLVVLLGGARGGEPSWQSLYENILQPNDADLALLLGEKDDHTASLYRHAKYLWEFPEFDSDWGTALDAIFGTNATIDKYSWRTIAKATAPSGPFSGTVEDPHGGGVVNLIGRWILQMKIQSLNLLEQYDRFIITRADQYYPCPINIYELDPSFMWIPTGEDWKGICDRFLITSKQHIMKALDILPPVVLHPERYYTFHGNIESFIKLRWEEEGIMKYVKRFRRTMFTASVNGDVTTWKANNRKPAFMVNNVQVRYKYVDEYYQAMLYCKYTQKTNITTSLATAAATTTKTTATA